MSSLLPDRHPTKDFFIIDVRDASPKDDLASMEHPVFSLSVKPDHRELVYDHRGQKITIVPSGRGLATIMDKDIIFYAISKLTYLNDRGRDISQWVDLTAHEVMVGCNWNTGARDYKRMEDALVRLRGTTIQTNIKTGGIEQVKGFGIIDEYEIERIGDDGKRGAFGRMSKIRVKLSEWTYRAVLAGDVLTISPMYFRLRRPLERRIYELARKHVGDQDRFSIGLATLQTKVGASGPLKKFRFNLKEIIRDANVPDYLISIDDQDLVTFARMVTYVPKGKVKVRTETLERAKTLAVEKGYDFGALEAEWHRLIDRNGVPDSPDGALIGFIKSKKSIRQRSMF